MTNSRNATQGFTLIEVILSIAILSIVSVIVLRLFLVSSELNEATKLADLSSNAAVNVIETAKNYRDLDEFLDAHPWITMVDQAYRGSINYDNTMKQDGPLTYELKFLMTLDPDLNNLYHISVSVIDIATLETLVDFDASHYYVREVVNHE